jgi:hypothetical protein
VPPHRLPARQLTALRRAFPELGTAPGECPSTRFFCSTDFRASIARRLPPSSFRSLVFGIVHQESAFDSAAISRSNAA